MRAILAVALVAGMAVPAAAQPKRKYKVGDVKGVKLTKTIAPDRGFVDDTIQFDGAGGRLLWVNSDSDQLCRIKVLDIDQGFADINTIDLSKVTLSPTDVQFVLGGEGVFVAYRVGSDEDASKAAVLLNSAGKVKRKFGPATDVRLTTYDGDPVVVAYDVRRKRTKKGRVQLTHTIEARKLESGKRVGKKVSFVADENGLVKKLDFRIQYWLDDYLTAVGVKGGAWDRKEDQRSPDVEGRYDVPERMFSKKTPIKDVTTHAQATQIRQEHSNESSFLRVSNDLTALQWHRDGDAARIIEIRQAFHHYDPKSLQYQLASDGGMYFSLTIDPVNSDAVARKKADPKWLDLYRVPADGAKAKRVGRILVGKRKVDWVASEEHWAVLYKHVGFSRGGTKLQIYKVK